MTLDNKENNPTFSRFTAHIASALSIEAATVDDLLEFIDCHAELRGLAVIADNLIPILNLLDEIGPNASELSSITIGQWQAICRYISDEAKTLDYLFPGIILPAKNHKNPFSKVIEKYPLYVALWFHYPEPSLQQSYQLIQAYLLLTQFYFRNFTEKEGKNYQNTTRESTRLIRQFADAAKPATLLALRPLLALMPAEPILMEEFLDELREMEDDDDEEEGDALVANVFKTNLAVLRRMLEYAAEHRGGYSRRNNRSWDAILKREAIRIAIISNDPDAQPVDFSIETLLMPSQTTVIENAARRAGCAPGEVKTGVEHFIFSEGVNEQGISTTFMAGRSPLAHIRRTRDKHHAVAMSNQLLPTQWGRLTLVELTLFLYSVSNLNREDKSKIKE